MDSRRLGRRLVASPAARAATLPTRVATVARHNGRSLRTSVRWLAASREHTNFTYDLTPLNQLQLAWFVAGLTGRPVADAQDAMDEIARDEAFAAHVRAAVDASPRRRTMDRSVRLGRRLGWYALVRLLEPQHVVETGTDKGLGTCVLAAAVLRNGSGRVTTIDVNPESGALIGGRYAGVVDRLVGDSVAALGDLDDVAMFIHDSDHSAAHEQAELVAVAPRLTPGALVLSDNSHVTDVLARWAEKNDRLFSFFAETPADHWFPGAGIGAASAPAAVRPRDRL